MIKRIELVNFMSHERTVIEPADGLTVLVGPNNCGKSAFVTALQILCHNAKSSFVLRHGTKQCEIIVETDDGHIVNWSRKKSGSPKYVINGEEFDRLRGGVPEELHEILGLDKVNCEKDRFDVHFGEQKTPIFLLDDSGKAAAQFFASSSDAIRLVEMQDRHKSKVRDSKRDLSRLTSEKYEFEIDLKTLEPIDSIEERLAQCEKQYEQISADNEDIEQLQILINAFEESRRLLEHQSSVLEVVSDLTEPPVLEDCEPLELLLNKETKLNRLGIWASVTSEALSHLSAPPQLEDEIELTTTLNNLIEADHESQRTNASANALAALEPPPSLGNETDLADQILEFKNALDELSVCKAKFRILSALEPAPELKDGSELESILSAFTKSKTHLKQTNKLLEQIETDFAELNSDVATWVDDNPSCPTCGSATQVEQLLGSVTGQGGGCHG